MSAQQYRMLIVAGNVLLMCGIGFLGYRAATGIPPEAAEQPPKGFNPTQFAISDDSGPKSSIGAHVVTWSQLDRPKPRVARVAVRPKNPVRPRVQDLSRLYTLVMANYNDKNPKKSTVILQDRRRNTQITVGVGGKFSGYAVLDISISGRRKTRQATVTVESRGKRHKIKLKPRSQRDPSGPRGFRPKR